MDMKFSPIEECLRTIAAGGIVIVLDAEDRENEGDFISAAEKITPEKVNFMLREGRGEFCVSMLPDRARDLRLHLAEEENTALNRTAFTKTVDLRTSKTGVSAFERAATAQALAAPASRAEDFARPGHVHPIIAQEGGVLRRAGHTEATVDLCRLAGLRPVGVLIEILDENGEMARRDRLFEIAAKHTLPITTIAELIRYRRRTEKLVHRTATTIIPTRRGDLRVYAYRVDHESQEPVALVKGDISKTQAPLVRMHSSCFTGDLIGSLRCDCGDQLRMALEMIHDEGAGALVYLPQEGRGIGLTAKIRAYSLQDEGLDTVEANHALGFRADVRDYGVGIQILKDLGLRRVRLLTNNPKKTHAFIYLGYDLEVVDQVPIVAPPEARRRKYLETKRDKLGHHLPREKEDGESQQEGAQ
jgi:3,4-dihydroxy 2-butanone 4-phosphate synthase/GTP cyclohydrolase II